MKDITLVVLAAGMGSRYGGLKQIDPIGPNGEIILELSVFDAIRAGFNKVVFIIKKEIEEDFKQAIGNKIASHVKVEYVYQEQESYLPEGYVIPEGRVKPWGTAHAILCCKDVVNEPFAVINADDFYGFDAFKVLYDYLIEEQDERTYAMVGFVLKNTLTDFGCVTRGVCQVDETGKILVGLNERKQIQRNNGVVQYCENGVWHDLDENSPVAMNMMGFYPSFIKEAEERFPVFLERDVKADPLKGEYYISVMLDELINEGKAEVTVLHSDDQWYGVTYQEDKPIVKAGIQKLIKEGKYPVPLWK